jgi:transcriptional regulator of arginine metabolism
MKKNNRQEAILQLIEQETIGTQDELMQKLAALGYNVTQATVSRDIKALKLVKSPVADGQYRYAAVKQEMQDISGKYYSILTSAVLRADFAGNMVAIKCYSGMANAACAAVDHMNSDRIVGTLAGDDTIFVLCRNEADAAEISRLMQTFAQHTGN